MSDSIEKEILEVEERLRQAMLDSDVEALDQVLAPELIFTNHLGHILAKQDDLNAHRSGLVKISELTPSEQTIQVNGDVAVVSVRVHLAGSYADTPSEADFRFTRIWAQSPANTWRLIAGHASVIA